MLMLLPATDLYNNRDDALLTPLPGGYRHQILLGLEYILKEESASNQNPLSSSLLMEDLQNTFLEAYNEHSNAVFRYCFFKVSDRELAKDLMQETFTKTWSVAIKERTHVDSIKGLLYKIAGNLIIDEYRRRGRRGQTPSLDTLSEEGFDPSFDDTDSLIDIIDGKEAIQLIQRIKEPYGEAVFMRYVQSLTLEEIAEATGESENTISVRVHRGLAILKKLFNHES
jgi:RNA polymerase sigma-70 factor, ECF subfamily